MSKLTSLIRKKYPGEYDDMDDATLEKAVLAKYPEYKDLAVPEDDPVNDAKKFLNTTPNISNTDSSEMAPSSQGWLKRAWETANKPLSNIPGKVVHALDNPYFGTQPIVDFAAEVANSLTSPLNAATAALTGGESLAGRAGMSGLSKVANVAGRVLSAPVAGEGIHDLVTEPTLAGKARGGLQAILGAIGTFHGGNAGGGKTARMADEVPSNVDVNTGEIFDNSAVIDLNKHPDIGSRVKIGPVNFEVIDAVSMPRDNIAKDITPPNPTAGIPSFGGRGKVTGSRQTGNVISVKAGEGLDKVQDLAEQGYKFSHQAPDGSYVFVQEGKPVVTETAVAQARPTAPNAARQQLGPQTDTKKPSAISELFSMPRSIMASTDMSAPLRQGLPLIHKKEYWAAIPDMFKAWGSEEGFKAVQDSIAAKPLFKKRLVTLNSGKVKELPSFAEDAGIKLTDLHDLSRPEEMLQSKWAEKIPLFGKYYRKSERAYIAFLNKLRADTFESLIANGKIFGAGGEANLPAARALAEFVNTATGRGSLDFRVKIGSKQLGANLESSAQVLGNGFFAPRLMASRMRMLNPAYYVFAPKAVRMERLKSLAAVTAAGNTFVQLAGMIPGAEVENNPNSSDFGKVKIGTVHIDPWAGFQQYVVAFNRLLRPESGIHIPFTEKEIPTTFDSLQDTDTGIAPVDLAAGYLSSPGGHMKSSVTGHDYKLGSLPVGSDKAEVATRFARYKLNPSIALALDLWLGKDANGKPIDVPEELVSKFIPIFLQDLKQLATENPNLLPGFARGDFQDPYMNYEEFHLENLLASPLAWFGTGVQNYKSK